MTDKFIHSTQVILGVVKEDSIELQGNGVTMNDLVGEILLHARDCSVTPCSL